MKNFNIKLVIKEYLILRNPIFNIYANFLFYVTFLMKKILRKQRRCCAIQRGGPTTTNGGIAEYPSATSSGWV